jgi:hypothetical protein
VDRIVRADEPHLDEAAGERALVHDHHRVERLAVFAARPGHEAVIRRVVYRRVEGAVQNDHPQLFVVLVLVLALLGYLHEHVDMSVR